MITMHRERDRVERERKGFERLSCSHERDAYVCSVWAFVRLCQSDLSCHVTQPWPRDLPSLPLLTLSLSLSQSSLTEKQESSDSFLWFMSSYHNHRPPPINPHTTTTAYLPDTPTTRMPVSLYFSFFYLKPNYFVFRSTGSHTLFFFSFDLFRWIFQAPFIFKCTC